MDKKDTDSDDCQSMSVFSNSHSSTSYCSLEGLYLSCSHATSCAPLEKCDKREVGDFNETTSSNEKKFDIGQCHVVPSNAFYNDRDESVSVAIAEASKDFTSGALSTGPLESGDSDDSFHASENDLGCCQATYANYPESAGALSDVDWNPYMTESEDILTPRLVVDTRSASHAVESRVSSIVSYFNPPLFSTKTGSGMKASNVDSITGHDNFSHCAGVTETSNTCINGYRPLLPDEEPSSPQQGEGGRMVSEYLPPKCSQSCYTGDSGVEQRSETVDRSVRFRLPNDSDCKAVVCVPLEAPIKPFCGDDFDLRASEMINATESAYTLAPINDNVCAFGAMSTCMKNNMSRYKYFPEFNPVSLHSGYPQAGIISTLSMGGKHGYVDANDWVGDSVKSKVLVVKDIDVSMKTVPSPMDNGFSLTSVATEKCKVSFFGTTCTNDFAQNKEMHVALPVCGQKLICVSDTFSEQDHIINLRDKATIGQADHQEMEQDFHVIQTAFQLQDQSSKASHACLTPVASLNNSDNCEKHIVPSTHNNPEHSRQLKRTSDCDPCLHHPDIAHQCGIDFMLTNRSNSYLRPVLQVDKSLCASYGADIPMTSSANSGKMNDQNIETTFTNGITIEKKGCDGYSHDLNKLICKLHNQSKQLEGRYQGYPLLTSNGRLASLLNNSNCGQKSEQVLSDITNKNFTNLQLYSQRSMESINFSDLVCPFSKDYICKRLQFSSVNDSTNHSLSVKSLLHRQSHNGVTPVFTVMQSEQEQSSEQANTVSDLFYRSSLDLMTPMRHDVLCYPLYDVQTKELSNNAQSTSDHASSHRSAYSHSDQNPTDEKGDHFVQMVDPQQSTVTGTVEAASMDEINVQSDLEMMMRDPGRSSSRESGQCCPSGKPGSDVCSEVFRPKYRPYRPVSNVDMYYTESDASLTDSSTPTTDDDHTNKAVDVIDSARSADPQMVRTVASLASSYPALLTVTGESIPHAVVEQESGRRLMASTGPWKSGSCTADQGPGTPCPCLPRGRMASHGGVTIECAHRQTLDRSLDASVAQTTGTCYVSSQHKRESHFLDHGGNRSDYVCGNMEGDERSTVMMTSLSDRNDNANESVPTTKTRRIIAVDCVKATTEGREVTGTGFLVSSTVCSSLPSVDCSQSEIFGNFKSSVGVVGNKLTCEDRSFAMPSHLSQSKPLNQDLCSDGFPAAVAYSPGNEGWIGNDGELEQHGVGVGVLARMRQCVSDVDRSQSMELTKHDLDSSVFTTGQCKEREWAEQCGRHSSSLHDTPATSLGKSLAQEGYEKRLHVSSTSRDDLLFEEDLRFPATADMEAQLRSDVKDGGVASGSFTLPRDSTHCPTVHDCVHADAACRQREAGEAIERAGRRACADCARNEPARMTLSGEVKVVGEGSCDVRHPVSAMDRKSHADCADTIRSSFRQESSCQSGSNLDELWRRFLSRDSAGEEIDPFHISDQLKVVTDMRSDPTEYVLNTVSVSQLDEGHRPDTAPAHIGPEMTTLDTLPIHSNQEDLRQKVASARTCHNDISEEKAPTHTDREDKMLGVALDLHGHLKAGNAMVTNSSAENYTEGVVSWASRDGSICVNKNEILGRCVHGQVAYGFRSSNSSEEENVRMNPHALYQRETDRHQRRDARNIRKKSRFDAVRSKHVNYKDSIHSHNDHIDSLCSIPEDASAVGRCCLVNVQHSATKRVQVTDPQLEELHFKISRQREKMKMERVKEEKRGQKLAKLHALLKAKQSGLLDQASISNHLASMSSTSVPSSDDSTLQVADVSQETDTSSTPKDSSTEMCQSSLARKQQKLCLRNSDLPSHTIGFKCLLEDSGSQTDEEWFTKKSHGTSSHISQQRVSHKSNDSKQSKSYGAKVTDFPGRLQKLFATQPCKISDCWFNSERLNRDISAKDVLTIYQCQDNCQLEGCGTHISQGVQTSLDLWTIDSCSTSCGQRAGSIVDDSAAHVGQLGFACEPGHRSVGDHHNGRQSAHTSVRHAFDGHQVAACLSPDKVNQYSRSSGQNAPMTFRKIVSPMQQLGVTVAGGEVRPSTWHQHQPTGSSYCSAGLRQAGWSSLVSVNGSTMSDVTSCLHSLRQSSHDSGLYPSGVHKERFNIPDKENQSPCKTIGLSCRRQQQRKQRSQAATKKLSWFIPIDTGDDITERQPFRQRRSGSVIREGEEEQSGVGLPMRQWLELARADLLNENSGSRLKDECAFFRLHLHRTVKDAEAELGREYDDRLMERPLPLMSLQEALMKRKPNFVSQSHQRQRHIQLAAKKRRLRAWARITQQHLFVTAAHGTDRPEHHPYGDNLHQPKKRIFSQQEMIDMTRRKYRQLPEVKEMEVRRRRADEYRLNRLRAKLFNRVR